MQLVYFNLQVEDYQVLFDDVHIHFQVLYRILVEKQLFFKIIF